MTQTIDNFFKDKLFKMGMFPEQAAAVLEISKNQPSNEAMVGRWQEPMDNYQQIVIVGLWIGIKQDALNWINDNLPNAWYKPMFMEKSVPDLHFDD